MLDNINLVKATLNKELESKDLQHNKILKLSQKLDRLIIDYYNSLDKDKADQEDTQE